MVLADIEYEESGKSKFRFGVRRVKDGPFLVWDKKKRGFYRQDSYKTRGEVFKALLAEFVELF